MLKKSDLEIPFKKIKEELKKELKNIKEIDDKLKEMDSYIGNKVRRESIGNIKKEMYEKFNYNNKLKEVVILESGYNLNELMKEVLNIETSIRGYKDSGIDKTFKDFYVEFPLEIKQSFSSDYIKKFGESMYLRSISEELKKELKIKNEESIINLN